MNNYEEWKSYVGKHKYDSDEKIKSLLKTTVMLRDADQDDPTLAKLYHFLFNLSTQDFKLVHVLRDEPNHLVEIVEELEDNISKFTIFVNREKTNLSYLAYSDTLLFSVDRFEKFSNMIANYVFGVRDFLGWVEFTGTEKAIDWIPTDIRELTKGEHYSKDIIYSVSGIKNFRGFKSARNRILNDFMIGNFRTYLGNIIDYENECLYNNIAVSIGSHGFIAYAI